ncbi:imelysin family protein [Ekhidna sp. MALMAid0563]|uniref:imelysin family protein n=1 Tax=Ekhidna sp. MALMAid0563 TaxID=3143937 RepID=UPI0032DE7542
MKKAYLILGLIALLGVMLIGCTEDEGDVATDNFNRKAMLESWADNIIVPGYESYVSSLENLNAVAETFTSSPSLDNLSNLRTAWLDANLAWQKVAMFEIGKAEAITLINFTNIYPTNTDDLVSTIESGDYDLTSINKQDEQGFPAIEYLIYNVRETDQAIVDLYAQEMANHPYKIFLLDLTERLETLATSVLEDWKTGYRDTFVNNDGSEATSSVNKLVNDYIFYYEKHLRAGKIGIPAGVFTGSKSTEKVEGLYSGKSKELFMAGLDAMQAFFNGKPDSNLAAEGIGLKTYLDFVQDISEGEDLGELINAQFESARDQAERLSDDFSEQVESDNSVMLETYDELQKNVVNMKVDMLQALNIRVDYVDADGD